MNKTSLSLKNSHTMDMFIFLKPDNHLLRGMDNLMGGKKDRPSLSTLYSSSVTAVDNLILMHKKNVCLGLDRYLEIHKGRLVYDTNQSPDTRPRMATKEGVLQTLTTGVNALWSSSHSRVVRQTPSCLIVSFIVHMVIHLFYNKTHFQHLRWTGVAIRARAPSGTTHCSPNGFGGTSAGRFVPHQTMYLNCRRLSACFQLMINAFVQSLKIKVSSLETQCMLLQWAEQCHLQFFVAQRSKTLCTEWPSCHMTLMGDVATVQSGESSDS